MISQLASLICIYCVLRFAEMTVAHLERQKAGQVSKTWQGFWIFYVVGAIIMIVITININNHDDKVFMRIGKP